MSNEISELAKALNAFQSEVVTVGKSAANPFFKSKYAPLDDIMLAAQPVLTKHGLAVMQLPDNLNGAPALTTIVMHTSGQSQSATVPLILAKEDPQGVGSAITYMRRYGYAAALGIVIDEDDDGNRATPRTVASKPAVGTAGNRSTDVAEAQAAIDRSAPKPPAPTRKLVNLAQTKLLLARARDASGLQDRQEVYDWFLEKVGVMPNEVTTDEVDDVLKLIARSTS